MIMTKTGAGLWAWSVGLLAGATACGGGDDAARAARAAEQAAEAAQEAAREAREAADAARAAAQGPTTTTAPLTPVVPGPNVEGNPSAVPVTNPGMPQPLEGEGAAGDRRVCVAPPGVTATPATIWEALGLLNSLPKPTTIACFLQALRRPLSLYLTSSTQSLQPATAGERSPRTFVLRGDLELSVVLEGEASNTLEIGYRVTPARSIKTEIVFPITRDVTPENFFDRVLVGDSLTQCGNCHAGEVVEQFDGFPNGAFISDVIEPYEIFEVSIDALRGEHEGCDAQAEPERCELLSALFDHGEVRPRLLGNAGL